MLHSLTRCCIIRIEIQSLLVAFDCKIITTSVVKPFCLEQEFFHLLALVGEHRVECRVKMAQFELGKDLGCRLVVWVVLRGKNGLGDILSVGVIASLDEISRVFHCCFAEIVDDELAVGGCRGAGWNQLKCFQIIFVSLLEFFFFASLLGARNEPFTPFDIFLSANLFALSQSNQISRLTNHRK